MHVTSVAINRGITLRWLSTALFLALVGLPLGVFCVQAVGGLVSGAVASGDVFKWALLVRSLGLASAAAFLSVMLGTPAGLASARLKRPLSLVCFFLFLAPLALPPAIHAYIWRNLALKAGLLGFLFVEGGSKGTNLAGATVSLVSAFWTIPALAAHAIASGAGRRFEVEARVFASAGVVAKKILTAQLVPSAVVAGGLVFILAFSDYGVASFWQTDTYPGHLISMYSSLPDLGAVAAAAALPVAVTLVLAGCLWPAASRLARRVDVEAVAVDADVLWRPGRALRLYLFVFLLVAAGVPTGVSLWQVLSGAAEPAVVFTVLADLGHTALVAVVAAAIAGMVALLAASTHWAGGRGWGGWSVALVAVAAGAFVIPGTAFALANVSIARSGFVGRWFSDTEVVLVYAHAARYVVLPVALAVVFFSMLDERYAYLVRLSGRGGWRATFIGAALAAPAVVAGCAVAVVLSVGELSISQMVSVPGLQPVSVDLFNLMHYARQGEAFAVGLVMMWGGAVAVCIALLVMGGLWKRYRQGV